MNYNRLFVVPTDETLDYFSKLLSGNPVGVDLQSLRVELMLTQDELLIEPARVYEAQAINVNVFYDSQLGQSSVIATLQSADMQERVKELHQEGAVREFYDWYIPYCVIKRNMPPLSKHFRTWRVQIANALCANERPLFFTGEYVEQQTLEYPPDFDYIQAMAAELGFRHNA